MSTILSMRKQFYLVYYFLVLSQTHASYGSNGCQEIDDSISDVWRLGDSTRLWPETDESFQQFCLNAIENNDNLIGFFDKIYPDNFHIQIICRLLSVERTRLLMTYCKNRKQRAKALKLFKILNQSVDKQEKVRQETLNKLIAAAEPTSTDTFKDMLKIWQNYHDNTIKAVKSKAVQEMLKQVMSQSMRLVNFYLANVKLQKMKRVNTNPCPKEWRPYSIQYAETIAFHRIFSDMD